MEPKTKISKQRIAIHFELLVDAKQLTRHFIIIKLFNSQEDLTTQVLAFLNCGYVGQGNNLEESGRLSFNW